MKTVNVYQLSPYHSLKLLWSTQAQLHKWGQCYNHLMTCCIAVLVQKPTGPDLTQTNYEKDYIDKVVIIMPLSCKRRGRKKLFPRDYAYRIYLSKYINWSPYDTRVNNPIPESLDYTI